MKDPALRLVVTGGTGGLGSAVVRLLLEQGHRVAVPYRGAEGWKALRAGAGPGASASLWGATADMSDVDAARSFMDAAAREMGGLDGVAALAGGYAGSGPLDATPVKEWDDMLRINLSSAHATCRAAIPHLLEGGGSVVTVVSRSAEAGGAGAAGYATAKMGVLTLTRALALENRDRSIRFNAISPLTIDTAANRAAMPKADRSRWTPPEAIARVVAWLLSPASASVTGAVIPV
jgi:NAD(P)-dependent dehydrogenase (short-subunit alcohol dehydrogenase family)